jgi:hypothetical protein
MISTSGTPVVVEPHAVMGERPERHVIHAERAPEALHPPPQLAAVHLLVDVEHRLRVRHVVRLEPRRARSDVQAQVEERPRLERAVLRVEHGPVAVREHALDEPVDRGERLAHDRVERDDRRRHHGLSSCAP